MISESPIQCFTTANEISSDPKGKNKQEKYKNKRKSNISLLCEQHKNSITSICTNKACQENDILLCHICVFEKHRTHSSECIPMELFFGSLLAKHIDTNENLIRPAEKKFHEKNQLCLALIEGVAGCFMKKMDELKQKLQNFEDTQSQVAKVKGKEINDFVKNLVDGNFLDGQMELTHLENFKSSIKSLIKQMEVKVNGNERDICLRVMGYEEMEGHMRRGLDIMSSLFEEMKERFKSVFDYVKMVKIPMDINVCFHYLKTI